MTWGIRTKKFINPYEVPAQRKGGQNDGHHITTMPAPLEGDTERWSNFRNGFVKLRPGVINTGTRNTQSQRFFQEPSGW